MPWIIINVLKGHSAEKKRHMQQAVAKAVSETLDIPPDWVKIQVTEMEPADHSIGGITIDKLPK